MYNNRHFGCLTLVVIISFGPTAAKNASTIDDDIDDDIDDFIPYRGERFDTFDWNLFKVMAKKYFGNMLISPISAKLAMINLYEGAEGQTAQELSNAMHLPINRAVTRDKFTYILNSLQAKNPAYSLNIGTRMYIDSAVQLRQRYAAIIKMLYATDVMNENLSDIHATADSINNWVKNITENNIDKIIEDEKILKGSVMVVVNALFFKGTWDRQPFSEKATKTGKFYPTATSNIDVLMMHSYGRFYYSSSTELDAKILRIPYSGHKYAAYFILPRKMSALDPLIEKLNSSAFSRQMWLMQDISIAVGIPKFKFDFTSHLESTFRELGIQEIFEDSATLTGILRTNRSSPQLSVSDILQKSGIEVNEKGTAAYVATEIQISNKIGEDNFIANRPFIFYIEDETTGVILFIGKVENPLQGTGNTNMASNLSTRFGEENKETNVPPGIPGVEERYNFFNIELLQELNEQTEGNLVVAPAGVKAALMTITEGSGGQTRQQLLSTLRLPVDGYGVRDAMRRTLSTFSTLQQSGINNTEITVATSLWMGKNVMISLNYKENLIRHYNSQVLSIDFADFVNSTKAMNDWIKMATKNHISSIVDPGGLSSDTRIILTTALYFKGTWLHAFNKKSTRLRCFQTLKNGCQEVNMMENFGQYSFAYVPSLDAEVIEIPYTGGKISMILLLPTRQGEHALHILSKDLSYIPVSVLLKSLRETEVLLQIPRFSIENKLDLRPALERLGIKDLFDFKANLSGIISKGPTRVSSVLHNAKIEVNEAGTIAAAATDAGALESKQISWLEGKLEQEKQIQLRAKSKPTPAQPNPPSLVLPPISKNRLMENSEETRRVIGEFQRSQVTTNDLLVQMLQIMKGNTQHQETVQGDLIDLAEPVTGQREKPSIINDVNVNKRVKIVDTRQGVVVESASRQQETVVNTSNNDSQRDETEHMREDWDDPTGYNQSSSGNTSNRDKEDGVKSC